MRNEDVETGDRVEITLPGRCLGTAGVVKDRINSFGGHPSWVLEDAEGCRISEGTWTASAFKKIGATMRNVRAGDIITNKKMYQQILFVNKYLVVLSSSVRDVTRIGRFIGPPIMIAKDAFLEAYAHCRIAGEEEEIIELSMDDVAKLAGKPVDKIRIKKET